MKKVISLTASAVAAALLLTACGAGGERIDVNAQIKPGSINDGYSYTSKYLDIFIRFGRDTGWEFKSQQELKEENGVTQWDNYEFGLNTAVRSQGSAVDLDAYNPYSGASVTVTYKLLPEEDYNITAREYLAARLDELEGTSTESGGVYHGSQGTVVLMPQEASIFGYEYTVGTKFDCLDMEIYFEEYDASLYMKMIAVKKDIFMAQIVLMSPFESDIEAMLEMFEKPQG